MKDEFLQQYQDEIAQAQAMQGQQGAYPSQMFSGGQKQNIVEWELDFRPELEDIERLLKCSIIKKDSQGNEYWAENPDAAKVFFNELGVNDILRTIRLLVNKNKVLSNYTIDEIQIRVKMLQNELRVKIYNNYELYGMDNDYKMNNYSMIILAIGSMIEDAYRRAMGGEGHKGLNEQRLLTQNETVAPQGQGYQQTYAEPKHGIAKLMPWNWGSR